MSEFEDTSDFVSRAMIGSLEPRFMKNDDGREWLLTPPHGNAQSWTFQEVTLINAIPPIAPKIITQAVRLQDAASLAEYVNRLRAPIACCSLTSGPAPSSP